jgi:hypothetical protein
LEIKCSNWKRNTLVDVNVDVNVDVECRCRMLMSNVDVNIFVCSKFVDALFVVIVLLLDVPTQAALINANATAACLKLICYFDGVLFLLKILNCCSDKIRMAPVPV